MSDKAKYWIGVGYPENMYPDWESDIFDIIPLPFAYCKHTLDIDSKSEHRKDHVHIIIAFPNTTTYKHALSTFNLLSIPGKIAFNTCQACVSIRGSYDYLIHDTEGCKKKGKHLYSKDCRITGNNFDIGSFEQISIEDKRIMAQEIADVIIQRGIENFADLYIYISHHYDNVYLDILLGYSGFFERLCKGFYLKRSKNA